MECEQTSLAPVLKLVVLNGLSELTPRWIACTLRLVCQRQHLWHDDDEVAHCAAVHFLRLLEHPEAIDTLESAVLPAATCSTLSHQARFQRLYRHSHCFVDPGGVGVTSVIVDGADSRILKNYGPVTKCQWFCDAGVKAGTAVIQFAGAQLSLETMHEPSDGMHFIYKPWFNLLGGYNWCYLQLLLGRIIDCILAVKLTDPIAVDDFMDSVVQMYYVIQTADGLQIPFAMTALRDASQKCTEMGIVAHLLFRSQSSVHVK